MRAIVMRHFGPPEVLAPCEVEDPTAGPGQALIEVEFVNVTFVETQIRRGRPPHPSMLPSLPAIPGNGVGGVVASVGPGVEGTLTGSRVVASTGGAGAYAELVCVPAESLVRVPDQVALRTAVALLSDGRTAIALIARARLRAGETVLVEAAGGGVGSLLVQLAKAEGAQVIGVAGGEQKLRLARELGADVAIDYTRSSWPSEVSAAIAGSAGPEARCELDVVFDGVGGATGRAAFELLGPGGRHCAFGMASGSFAAVAEDDAVARGVTLVRGAPLEPAAMRRLTAAALDQGAAGRLTPTIGQTFPLTRAADAHRAIESRCTLGKTLLLTRPAGPAAD